MLQKINHQYTAVSHIMEKKLAVDQLVHVLCFFEGTNKLSFYQHYHIIN